MLGAGVVGCIVGAGDIVGDMVGRDVGMYTPELPSKVYTDADPIVSLRKMLSLLQAIKAFASSVAGRLEHVSSVNVIPSEDISITHLSVISVSMGQLQ